MSKGIWTRRLAVAISAAVITAIVAFPAAAQDVQTSGTDDWGGVADGDVVTLDVQFPQTIASVLEDHDLPGTIHDEVSSANAQASWEDDSNDASSAVGEMLATDGTIAGIVQEVQNLVDLPNAKASCGDSPHSDSLVPSVDADGLHVGVGESSAAVDCDGSDIDAKGDASVNKVSVTLAGLLPDEVEGTVRGAVDTLLGLLYGGEANPASDVFEDGLVGELNSTLGGIMDTLAADPVNIDVEDITGLDLSIPTITSEDLLDKPLVSIGQIVSETHVGEENGYKIAEATSYVEDIDLVGGLVQVDVLRANAKVAAKSGDAKVLGKGTTIARIKIGDNVIEVGGFDNLLDDVTVNGKSLREIVKDLPQGDVLEAQLDQAQALLGEILALLGVTIDTPGCSGDDQVEIGDDSARAHQDCTALLIGVHPTQGANNLGGIEFSAAVVEALDTVRELLPTVDLKVSTASADVGINVPTVVLGRCIGECNPTTGLPTNLFVWLGPVLLGVAVLTKKFVLAK